MIPRLQEGVVTIDLGKGCGFHVDLHRVCLSLLSLRVCPLNPGVSVVGPKRVGDPIPHGLQRPAKVVVVEQPRSHPHQQDRYIVAFRLADCWHEVALRRGFGSRTSLHPFRRTNGPHGQPCGPALGFGAAGSRGPVASGVELTDCANRQYDDHDLPPSLKISACSKSRRAMPPPYRSARAFAETPAVIHVGSASAWRS